MHGDCLELMKKIPDNSIDCVLTDPPYGTTACKWDTVIDFDLMWIELKRITKDNGAICLFGSEPFSSHLRLSNLKMFKYDWIWYKNTGGNFTQLKKQPLRVNEIVSVFGGAAYYPQKVERFSKESKDRHKYKVQGGGHGHNKSVKPVAAKKYDSNKSNPRTVLEFKSVPNARGKLHPTQKPVALLEYLIKTYTLENETVLDFTMGSGSTGVACKNLNRKFIGIEKDDKYFAIAKERIESS